MRAHARADAVAVPLMRHAYAVLVAVHAADISGNVCQLSGTLSPNTRIVIGANVTQQTQVKLDATGKLLFPSIAIKEAWCVTQGGAPVALATDIQGQVVAVTLSASYTGAVLCTLDQSEHTRRYQAA